MLNTGDGLWRDRWPGLRYLPTCVAAAKHCGQVVISCEIPGWTGGKGGNGDWETLSGGEIGWMLDGVLSVEVAGGKGIMQREDAGGTADQD